MTDRFENCIAFVLAHETVYNAAGGVKVERDPNDPGGTTKYGIDQRDHPNVDVANLTEEGARAIYSTEEWTKGRCENFKTPWDMALLDSAVNPGLHFIGVALQRAVNRGLTVDGVIGPKTIAATNASALDAVVRFLNLREAYYNSLPDYKQGRPFKVAFIHGWTNRVNDLRKACGV